MAGILSLGNDQWIGTFTLNEANGVENGVFVSPNYANGTVSLADATTGDGDVLFVVNENTSIPEELIDDEDFVVKNGKYIRGHVPQAGEILVTTKYNGTLAKGDTVAVGVGGAVEAIGARTPKYKFSVKELTTAFGQPAVSLIVL